LILLHKRRIRRSADVRREGRQKRLYSPAKAPERRPLPCPKQHARQFTAIVEDWAARIPLSGLHVEFHHVLR
jgi:hypothetical protein